jgi:hypothetical protein
MRLPLWQALIAAIPYRPQFPAQDLPRDADLKLVPDPLAEIEDLHCTTPCAAAIGPFSSIPANAAR